MRWTVHGERVIYDNEWIRLVLTDVELPSGQRFEHHVVRLPHEAAGTVVDDPDRGVLLLWRFVATSAEYVGEPTDGDEAERVEWLGWRDVRDELRAGHVGDGLSLTALLWRLSPLGIPGALAD
jgi:hypothetical protein